MTSIPSPCPPWATPAAPPRWGALPWVGVGWGLGRHVGAGDAARHRAALLPTRLPAAPVPPPNPPQTFLLPFDPEEHEDVDEWRAYEGPLSSKDLHKVG